MPDVSLAVESAASSARIWDFVQDMDNWAPFVTGYQSHEKLTERESVWIVKGELGGITRRAEFRVLIEQWAGPERVTFRLEGLDEPVTGEGGFFIAGAAAPVVAEKPGLLARVRDWLARRVLARLFGKGEAAERARPAGAASVVTFQLALNAGGMAGPVLNLLLAPMLKPVAEDLANRIMTEVEARG